MQFQRRVRKTDTEERILPLINVVFLLLIFFMLAGHLAESDAFPVSPPASDSAGEPEPQNPGEPEKVVLLLAADGRLALNGEAVVSDDLKAALAGPLAAAPDLRVSLKADSAAEAAMVVALMETLRDAGVRDLQLFAQPLQPQAVQP